jgi:hypothetical protein
MRIERRLILSGILILAAATVHANTAKNPETPSSAIRLADDRPVTLRFFGSPAAELFAREVDESFQGVLQKNFVAETGNGFPAGFVNASPHGQPWAGTMWTRDGGTYLRELVMRGYYQHASLVAECMMSLVEKNQEGFYSFPRFFRGSQPGSGTELDGTSAIVIGMVLLWERLPAGNPTRNRIQEFLFNDASPVAYFKSRLRNEPMVAGTGEFGCGMRLPGECYNVVQNNLTMLALLAAANMAEESGNAVRAEEDRHLAAKIDGAMEKYLVAANGAWIWAIDPKSLKADPAVIDATVNRGTGSLNGVASMYADVLGFDPVASSPKAMEHSRKTFQQLYQTPLRKAEFDRYGIWTQSDVLAAGMLSAPSYGQGYALQDMLLFDDLPMAAKALSFLANTTFSPVPEYKLHRDSPYYFYERTYSPDVVGKAPLAEGCGALNLVNVTEPLKVSRLLLGVDDSAPGAVRILPRIPQSWKGAEARNWPIRTRAGVVRADIFFERKGTGAVLTVKLAPGQRISRLKVRMPSKDGNVWLEKKNAASARFVTK